MKDGVLTIGEDEAAEDGLRPSAGFPTVDRIERGRRLSPRFQVADGHPMTLEQMVERYGRGTHTLIRRMGGGREPDRDGVIVDSSWERMEWVPK